MKARKFNVTSNPDLPVRIAAPTDAEARAALLEQDDAAVRDEQTSRRHALIREAAYAKYEQRGAAPGHEQQDWLEAEREVDQAIAPSWRPDRDDEVSSP